MAGEFLQGFRLKGEVEDAAPQEMAVVHPLLCDPDVYCWDRCHVTEVSAPLVPLPSSVTSPVRHAELSPTPFFEGPKPRKEKNHASTVTQPLIHAAPDDVLFFRRMYDRHDARKIVRQQNMVIHNESFPIGDVKPEVKLNPSKSLTPSPSVLESTGSAIDVKKR